MKATSEEIDAEEKLSLEGLGEREKENNEPIQNRDNSKERKERNKDKTRNKERKCQRDQHLDQ